MYRTTLALRRGVCAMTLLSFAAVSAVPVAFAQAKKAAAAPISAVVPGYYGPQPAKEDIDLSIYAQIRAEGLQHSHVMEYMSGLSDGIGPRLTGSPNMKKANEWTKDRMIDAGLENAHLEDWGEFGMGWAQVNSWARMITPDTEPIWIQAAPWSAATKGAVSGDAVLLEPSSEADLAKYKGKLAGKVVLLGAPHPMVDITEPLFTRYTDEELKEMEGPPTPRRGAGPAPNIQQLLADRARLTALRTAALKMMTEEGVAAIITPARDGGKGGGSGEIFDDNGANLSRTASQREGAVAIPNAVTTVEMYGRMYRLLKANVPVKLEVNIETVFTGDHEHGFNTVAEIPGNDPKLKDQIVMVGGHLDSWIAGTGATDNGAGSVVAMEAVRILKALGLKPKRTIRVALWSGEEQGLFGSRGYVKQHFGEFATPAGETPSSAFGAPVRGPLKTTKEWETLDAYYNLDNGSGKVRGVYTQGNFAIGPIFAQWIAPLKDLGVTTITNRNTGGTDHLSFDAVGLPGFQYIQDELDYETRTHHSNLDTVEHIKEADLEQAAVVEAIFLYNTSEREAMMPRKPFPHPELDKDRNAALKNIFPTAAK
jgi:carboxypeptidase Q